MSKKKEAERAHALLSASGASRWMNCNGSARLEEQFPESESDFAKEGTLAHELAELKLRKYFIETGMAKRAYTTKLNKLKKNELWQDEMEGYTEEYVDYVKQTILSFSERPMLEIESKLDFNAYVPESFGTADCIIVAGSKLYVVDLKYGKGVPVYAENNPQLKLYALGAYLKYSILYNITEIQMTIVQPRLSNISESIIPVKDLLQWAETILKPNAERAFRGEGGFNAGEHCKFCRAKAQCRARAEKNMIVETAVKEPALLSNEEIGELLKKAGDLAAWASDLESYALNAALKGDNIPGWKAVNGRSSRKFNDTDEVFKLLIEKEITEEALLYDRKPLSLTNVEKLISKKVFNEVLADHVITSPGKPTLVQDTDKREAITNVVKASDEFSVYDENNAVNS